MVPPVTARTFKDSKAERLDKEDGFVTKNSHSIKAKKYALRTVRLNRLRKMCGLWGRLLVDAEFITKDYDERGSVTKQEWIA